MDRVANGANCSVYDSMVMLNTGRESRSAKTNTFIEIKLKSIMVNDLSSAIQVLHVDDEPGFSEMAAEFVERQSDHLKVETATSAPEALERIQASGFHCVVSDYDMPGMNGIKFLKAVREDYPDIPFILYTGKGSEEVASEAISAGVTDYLQKESSTTQYEVLANRITNTVDKYRAQNELEVSQRRLNLFFEQSPLGVIRWDENFDLERMNEEASEILGYNESDLKGRSWEAIVSESDLDAVDEVVSNLLEDKGGYHSVNENVRNDGERIVCEWHNRVVTDDAGQVIAIYSQFQDITERQRRERRFEAIFNNSYTFTGLMEPDGTLLEANETALSFGGVAREDVVGKPIWDAYWFEAHDDARAAAKEAVQQARHGELYRDEVKVRGADDDAVIDFSVRPIFDENGEVTLLVPEGREITNRKEREQELRETKVDLESTVTQKDRLNRAFELFLEIVNDDSLSIDEQMAGVLDLGVEFLDLDIGIISNIDPPDYTVEYVVPEDGSIEQGATLDFRDTFCTLVYDSDGPVAFHTPEKGDIKDHPCYQDLGLHAYLGEPLIVEGERYGTLNFSSPNSREEPFSDGDRAFIRTMAEWVTKELARNAREEEIDRLHRLHRTVLSNMRETVLLTDENGQITYVCPNVHFIFGYDDEVVAEMGSTEALFGENLVEFTDLESAGEIRNLEATVTDSEETEHTVLVTVREVDIEDGRWLYSIRDITERKEGERELQERNRELRAVLDSVRAAIWIRDLNSRFLLINQNFRDLFGLDDDADIVGKRPSDLFSEEIAAQFQDNDEQVITTEEPFEIQEEVLTERGLRTYLTRITPVFDAENELVATCGVASDITAQKERERELERQNERLDEFASLVSHDLRNPLNVAEGRLALAVEECESEHLAQVTQALDRMETLIDDMLSLANIGEDVGNLEPVELAAVTDRAWGNVDTKSAVPVIQSKATLKADATRLQQILENLLRNAVEHGGDNVTVTIGDLPDGFFVEDDGPGFHQEDVTEALEPGYSSTEDGTGFGLSIVRDIAQAHGWEMGLTESGGGGARIEFTGVETG